MDLSTIDSWTRAMLEAEATRRGIKSPEFRTRGDLVRLILRHRYGDQVAAGRERFAKSKRTFDEVRSLFGTAVGAALSSLPEPIDSLLRARGGAILPRTEPPPAAMRTHVVPESEPSSSAAVAEAIPPAAAVPVEAGGAESGAETAAATEAEAGAVTEAETAAETESATETGAETATAAESATEAEGGGEPIPVPEWPKPPPPVREATTRTFDQEPIRTRSMAQLLASQGHRERALAIYEELCAQNSEDEGLDAEATRLRNGESIAAPALPRPAARDARLPPRNDRIECAGEPADGLRLRWQVSEGGTRRARAVLGNDGELAVRLVTIRPDPERVVRSEITEHGPVDTAGEWTADGVAGTVRCFATIGLRAGERFVSIAHARAADPA